MKIPGVLERLRLSRQPTSRAPAVPRPAPEMRTPPTPTVERRSPPEVSLLREKRKAVEPPAPVAGETSIMRSSTEKSPAKRALTIRERSPTLAEAPRGRPFFGRDSSLARGIRQKNPNCPPLVVDFLSSRTPSDPADIPPYVQRAQDTLPRAWTTDLDAIARSWPQDSAQAVVALALQTATMAVQVASDYEQRPSMSCLQEQLDASRKQNADLVDRLTVMEKSTLDAAAAAQVEIDRMKHELIQAKAHVAGLTGELALRTEEALSRLGELGNKEAELREANQKLGELGNKVASFERDPYRNVDFASEFAYYMAYADAIRAAGKGGLEVGPLIVAFRSYVAEHPLHPEFLVPILDLADDGVDLSWYPNPAALIRQDGSGLAPPEESIAGGASAEDPT